MQECDVPLGERDDVHAGERKSFEKSGRVFLVTAESIQRFRKDNIEAPTESIPQQCLESGTQ